MDTVGTRVTFGCIVNSFPRADNDILPNPAELIFVRAVEVKKTSLTPRIPAFQCYSKVFQFHIFLNINLT